MKIILVLLTLATALLAGQIVMAERLSDPTVLASVKWSAFGLLTIGAVAMARDGAAVWCGLLAAVAVMINPLWPMAIPSEYANHVLAASAAITGATVIRKWQ
jgi:ABC-type uncharacterized transport system permease subunit